MPSAASLDGRSTGVAQAEDACALVERLAGGIVERAAEDFVDLLLCSSSRSVWLPETIRQIDGKVGVPRNHAIGRVARDEPVGVDVTLRGAPGCGGFFQAMASVLATFTPTSSEPASPGPSVNGDRVDLLARDSSLVKRLMQHRDIGGDVLAEASSGTTPPYFSCTAICEATTFERTQFPHGRPPPLSRRGGLDRQMFTAAPHCSTVSLGRGGDHQPIELDRSCSLNWRSGHDTRSSAATATT